jgi:hypothetical protein
MWFHQVTGLWVVFGSFCPLGYLQQGGDMSLPDCAGWSELLLFHQVAAALLFSFNSVWSIPPWPSWGNSVLNVALYPMRSAPGSTTCPTLEGWPVTPYPLTALVPILTSAQCWFTSFRRLACSPAPALRLCCFSCLFTESSAPCPTPILQGRFSISTVGVRLQFAVYGVQFCCEGWVQSAQGLCWIIFRGDV